MGSQIAIHINVGLDNQVKVGRALHAGFSRHGLRATLTGNRDQAADIHVVLGPWYALEKWRDANTLYIDRAYWGDPDAVSLHWLRDREKENRPGAGVREVPELKTYKQNREAIWLCDYGKGPPEGWIGEVRKHPAEHKNALSLSIELDYFGSAWGGRTTALVTAAAEGLVVHTDDKYSPVAAISGQRGGREDLFRRLSWHNWKLTEIERGEAWEHLSQ